MLIHLYRVKHKPTGLYYTPGPWSNLSEKGKIYSSGNNILNWLTTSRLRLTIGNQRIIKKYLPQLSVCGKFGDVFCGGSWTTGYTIDATKNDFEIETITFVNK